MLSCDAASGGGGLGTCEPVTCPAPARLHFDSAPREYLNCESECECECDAAVLFSVDVEGELLVD